jgi:NAD(P)-dependent dehydrogenase (short-subunit alcohol dehydrogenase family)
MTDTFAGKVALVTGAGSGIGRAIATSLVAQGASVVVTDIDGERATLVAKELERAHAVQCDVTDPAAVEAAVEQAVQHFGSLTILVNNAAMEVTAPIVETTPTQLDAILRVNIGGVFNGIKYGGPQIARAGGGAIVSVASAAGWRGVALMGAYAATKAAVINLTKSAALEFRAANVRINCVCPGMVDTPMLAQMKSSFEARSPAPIDDLIAMKQGRIGVPDDIARAVSYLASDTADFVNGVALAVDNTLAASLF